MKYDFKEYTNIEDMIGYVGFITPAGTFYRVRKMNENGVSVENKDGSKKNNVKISKDSSSIEISNPK